MTKRGSKHSQESIEKMRIVQKGHPGYFKGYHHTEEAKKRISDAKKKDQLGENNPMYGRRRENSPYWKGENAGYKSIHEHLRTIKPTPKECEFCNKEKRLDCANIINHTYTRNPEDYIYLCRKCHKLFEKLNKKLVFNLRIPDCL